MRVVVVPADRAGCGYYRLVWPAQAVALARPDWEVEVRPPESVRVGTYRGEVVDVRGLEDLPDVLVLQRVGTAAQEGLLRWAAERGVATVVDFDDAMWCIDPRNAAKAAWEGTNPTGQHWRTCDRAAAAADLVTVTTAGLASRYGRHGRVEVLPNRVPLAATTLEGEPRDGRFTAGWAGYTATHPGDCEVAGPAARMVDDLGGRLRVVADAPGAAAEWGLPADRVEAVPPQRFGPGYYRALGSLDLMLVGLRDTTFNQCKSTLKVLEAGAGGAPSVAPANRPHRALARTGYPVTLADSPAEWARAAELAHGSPESWHEERRQEVREHTRAHETIEGNAGLWADAWERAARRAARRG